MKDRRYIDFKLYATRPAGTPGACQVALLPTPEVGETIVPVTVPAEKGPSQDQLAYLADKSITLRNLVALGKGLANWLLPEGTIRDLFAEALRRAGNAGGVRMRLIIADHEMKRWPWEYAYFDPLGGPDSMRGFLALEPRVSLVRHEPLPHPHPSPVREEEVPSDLRMLVVAASPKEQRELDLAKEVRFIKKALEEFDLEGVRIRADPILMDATPPEVAEALRGAGSAHIFHFVGHGIARAKSDPFTRGVQREEGYLFLVEDKDANTQAEVSADLLAKYLQQADVRLAVLGACYSGLRSERYPWDSVAGALVARDIPVVVSMQFEVIDAYAIAFSRAFYGALAAGLSLDEATALGRLAMFEEPGADLAQGVNLEWGVPVLYSRLPDGVVFPRLVERETETAKQMRNLIQQTVDTITETGEVVGIRAEVVDGAFQVSQRAGTVAGTLIGVDADRVSGGRVEQDVDTVSGTVIGARLDELDF
jgi:hypothetical protein